MNIKINSIWLVVILGLGITFSACEKNSAYYNYSSDSKTFDGTVLQYVESQNQVFDSLLLVLDILPDLKDSLSNEKVTLFAPTNASFQTAMKFLNITRVAQGKRALSLKDCSPLDLDTLMTRYILRGNYSISDFAPFVEGARFKSIKSDYEMHVQYKRLNASGFVNGGPQYITYSDPKKSVVIKNWQSTNTTAVDIIAKNGTINLLTPEHDFGFNEFQTRMNK